MEEGPDPYLRPVSGERIDESEFLKRSGVEILHAQIRGELPLPPLHHLLGIVPTEATLGAASCSMPVSGWLATPFGWPQGGFIVLLADLALALATQTTLAAGEGMASVDIKVNFLRPVAGDGSRLEARAKVVHRGRSLDRGDCGGARRRRPAGGARHRLGRPARPLTSGDLAFAAADTRPARVRTRQLVRRGRVRSAGRRGCPSRWRGPSHARRGTGRRYRRESRR